MQPSKWVLFTVTLFVLLSVLASGAVLAQTP